MKLLLSMHLIRASRIPLIFALLLTIFTLDFSNNSSLLLKGGIMAKTKISIAARLLGFILTLSAAAVMGANKQSIEVVDHIFTAKFSDWTSFTNFVIVNSIACAVHFAAIFIPSGTQLWRPFVALDMLMCILLITSWGSALTCLELLKYGSRLVGWSPICSVVPRFCSAAIGALVLGFIGFFIGFGFCCFGIHYLLNPLLLPE